MKYDNEVVQVSNYATDAMNDLLVNYGQLGYKLVNALLAKTNMEQKLCICFSQKNCKSKLTFKGGEIMSEVIGKMIKVNN